MFDMFATANQKNKYNYLGNGITIFPLVKICNGRFISRKKEVFGMESALLQQLQIAMEFGPTAAQAHRLFLEMIPLSRFSNLASNCNGMPGLQLSHLQI